MKTESGRENYMSLIADVEALKERPLPEVREKIAEKVVTYFNKDLFDEAERNTACEIIRMLARDIEVNVRRAIAENIKDNKTIPHDIALKLASDVLEVSLPILEFSEVLTDEDLIYIIKSTKQIARLLAISRRCNNSEVISGALIKTSHEDVVISLFSNNTARISQDSLEFAVGAFRNSGNILKALVARGNLPVVIVEKILGSVSTELRKELIEKHKIDEKQSTFIVNDASEMQIINALNSVQESSIKEAKVSGNINQEGVILQIENLVSSLSREGRLTESLIIRSICEGNLLFFELGISRKAQIPLANTKTLLRKGGVVAMRSLWKRAKMPESTFQAMNIIINFAILHLKEFSDNADYGKHLLEYIQDNNYDKTIPLMPYMMSIISSGLRIRNVI